MGAIVAVETAIKYISAQDVIEEMLGDDTAVKSFLIDTIIATKQTMEKETVTCSSQSQDLATTLIIVVATPDIVAVAQIGDGMVVVKNLQGSLNALTVPNNGEYINHTTFLTTVDALYTTQVKICRETITNVALLTDGLHMLAMKMVAVKPYSPFFTPLFDFVSQVQDPTTANKQLANFLCSERITQRTDDDLTLILPALNN